MELIAERIAADGYAVLVPDTLYRGGRFGPVRRQDCLQG